MARSVKVGDACKKCGRRLKRMYPGGDPENGPADVRCPEGCLVSEPCEVCDRGFHRKRKSTPGESYLHDSFGNGVPEIDKLMDDLDGEDEDEDEDGDDEDDDGDDEDEDNEDEDEDEDEDDGDEDEDGDGDDNAADYHASHYHDIEGKCVDKDGDPIVFPSRKVGGPCCKSCARGGECEHGHGGDDNRPRAESSSLTVDEDE